MIQQSYFWVYIHRDTYTLAIFIAALFIIAKTWKQLKYPSTDEWIKKMHTIKIAPE